MCTMIVLHDNKHEDKRWLLWAGAVCPETFLVWGDLDDALDEVGEWAEKHAPGWFCDEAVADEYKRAIAEGLDEESAQQQAEVDTTSMCDGRHYMNSWEWGIVREDPTRAEIIAVRDESRGA